MYDLRRMIYTVLRSNKFNPPALRASPLSGGTRRSRGGSVEKMQPFKSSLVSVIRKGKAPRKRTVKPDGKTFYFRIVDGRWFVWLGEE